MCVCGGGGGGRGADFFNHQRAVRIYGPRLGLIASRGGYVSVFLRKHIVT